MFLAKAETLSREILLLGHLHAIIFFFFFFLEVSQEDKTVTDVLPSATDFATSMFFDGE